MEILVPLVSNDTLFEKIRFIDIFFAIFRRNKLKIKFQYIEAFFLCLLVLKFINKTLRAVT